MSKPNDTAFSLATQVANGKVGHAYLFIGPRGTGKTTAARILAKALNCRNVSKEGDPCDECETCKAIREGKFLDLIEIDAASNRGIDDIRALKDTIGLSSFSSKYKIYIVDEVHMLTTEAFNALLKTLEEPPKHVVFVLCTTEGHKVPETIKSRCQVFKFKRATTKQLVERLESIAKKEGAKLSDADFRRIAAAAYGGFRDADTILQQVIEGGVSVDSLLTSNVFETFVELTGYIIQGKTQAALSLIGRLFDEGSDLTNWCNEYIKFLRDLLYVQIGSGRGQTDVSEEMFAKMEEEAFKLSSAEVVVIIERFLKASNEIKISALPQLPLELAAVELCEKRQILDEVDEAQPNKEETADESKITSIATLGSLSERWEDILKEVRPFNHSVEALLRSCKPISLKGNQLILEVSYAFHKERLEVTRNRQIFEKVLVSIFGSPIKVKCVLKSKEGAALTDKNIEKPQNEQIVKNAVEVFDGGVDL